MKVTKVWSFLAAGAVLLAAATALSGDRSTSGNQLVDYDSRTSELWAYPSGGALTTYLNRAETQYLAADLGSYEPPDPCLTAATFWNRTVEYDQEHGVKSTRIFSALLEDMARRACSADLTAITTGSPLPLVKITPTSSKSGD